MTSHFIDYTSTSTPGIAVICTCGHGIAVEGREETSVASVQTWIDEHLRFFK